MIIDFSKIDLSSRPLLILKTLSGKIIQPLGLAYNLTGKLCYNEVSEIHFDIPRTVDGALTPNYDLITGMMIVDMVGYGQFITCNPKVTKNGIYEIKSCTAYSLEYEFTRTKIFLENGTYNFWNPVAPAGTILGIIREHMPDWSIGSVDDTLIGKYRTFEENDANIYNFMKSTLQDTYSCVFEFDTYKRVIHVKDVSTKAATVPVYLSLDNLIKEIEIEEDSENIFTCLDVSGADGVDIRNVNPTGTNKIYNLDYYMNTVNFSQEMIDKWNYWKATVENSRLPYYNLSVERAIAIARRLTEEATLTDLQGELASLENLRAVYVQAIGEGIDRSDELKKVKRDIEAKSREISSCEALVERAKSEVQSIGTEMKEINDSCAFTSFFSEEEMRLLRPYFKEDAIQDSSFAVSPVKSYNTAGVSMKENNVSVRISDSTVTKILNTVGKRLYTISGGSLSVNYGGKTLTASLIHATGEMKAGEILLSLYVGHGRGYDSKENKEFSFQSGNLSFVGNYSSILDDTTPDPDVPDAYATGHSISIDTTSARIYFTKNTTEYEQQYVAWDLYEYGRDCLQKLAYPSYTFDIDSANFMAIDEFESFAKSLSLGKKVYLNAEESVLQPILVSVEIDFENINSLKLQFGNRYALNDSSFSLADLLDKSISMGKTVDFKKFSYNAFVDSGASTSVRDFMNSALDVAKNAVLSSGGQGVMWDDSGLHLRKYTEDKSGYEPEQIWAINNVIAFTDDNWDSVKMAIGKIFDPNLRSDKNPTGTAYGICAPYIVGTLLAGESLVIESQKKDGDISAFRVDGNGASLHNAVFDIYNGSSTQITLNPYSGFAIGSYPLYSGDEYTIDPDNAKFWVDLDGKVHMKGTLEGCDGTFSGELSAASGTFSGTLKGGAFDGGSINIGDGNFTVDNKGNMTANDGTFKGTLYGATYRDPNGHDMMNKHGEFTSDYLNIKGITVTDTEGNTTFHVGNNGDVEIYGDITMKDGTTIRWKDIKGKPDYVLSDNVKKLADGKYMSGTFIDGTTIYSPNIVANEFIVTPKDDDADGAFILRGNWGGKQVTYMKMYPYDALEPRTYIETWGTLVLPSCRFEPGGFIDFDGVTVKNLSVDSTTAVFG